MFMTDTEWAKNANPGVFTVRKEKEEFDLKLLKKKKAAKDLQDKLW